MCVAILIFIILILNIHLTSILCYSLSVVCPSILPFLWYHKSPFPTHPLFPILVSDLITIVSWHIPSIYPLMMLFFVPIIMAPLYLIPLISSTVLTLPINVFSTVNSQLIICSFTFSRIFQPSNNVLIQLVIKFFQSGFFL